MLPNAERRAASSEIREPYPDDYRAIKRTDPVITGIRPLLFNICKDQQFLQEFLAKTHSVVHFS